MKVPAGELSLHTEQHLVPVPRSHLFQAAGGLLLPRRKRAPLHTEAEEGRLVYSRGYGGLLAPPAATGDSRLQASANTQKVNYID